MRHHLRFIRLGSVCTAAVGCLFLIVFFCAHCPYGSAWSSESQSMYPENGEPPAFSDRFEARASETAPTDVVSEGDSSPLSLTLQDTLLMALENNVGFQIERLQPKVAETQVQIESAVFDPVFSAGLDGSVARDDSDDGDTKTDSASAVVRADQFLPYGTEIGLSGHAGLSSNDNGDRTDNREAGVNAELTQPLLKGRGLDANLASLRQARLSSRMSVYELRAAAEELLSQTEQTVWEYVLARRSIDIYEASLDVAERQLEEIRMRIRIGKLAESELAAAEAERAFRIERLINARADLTKQSFNLVRLLNPGEDDEAWERKIDILEAPETSPVLLSPVSEHVSFAMENRPDLNQARLEIRKGEIEVVRTKNGLLPRLDFFLTVGTYRYVESFSRRDDNRGDATSVTAGLDFELPYRNRDAVARHEQARLSAEESRLALRNLQQLAQMEVRSAYVDVQRLEELIKASRATRLAREKAMETEQEKFRVGKSTAFILAQAQRDLVEGQIDELEAVVQYRKAMVDLYRLDGSLLARKGIETPEP